MSDAHQKLKVIRVDSEKNRETGLISFSVHFQRVQDLRIRFKDSSQLQHKQFYESNLGNEVYVQIREGILDNGRPWFNFSGDGDPFTRSSNLSNSTTMVDKNTGEVIPFSSESPSPNQHSDLDTNSSSDQPSWLKSLKK